MSVDDAPNVDPGADRVVHLVGTPEQQAQARAAARERVEQALANKREFEAMFTGAKNRLALMPGRDFLAQLGFGVANFAFVQVLNGKIEIKTAREAVELAKAGVELARLESGDPTSIDRPLTDEERANTVNAIAKLQTALEQRKKDLDANEGATLDDDELPPGSSTDDDDGATMPDTDAHSQEA